MNIITEFCLPSITKADMIHGWNISALEHVRMLTLSSYVLLACINAIYKYGHAWVI